MSFDTPLSYASHLAGYISDPSTIHAHVMNEFGRAPSVDRCRHLREAKQQQIKRVDGYRLADYRFRLPYRCGHPDTEENSYIDINGNDQCLTCEKARQAEVERIKREDQERLAALEAADRARRAELRKMAEDKRTAMISAAVEEMAKRPPRPAVRLYTDTIAAVARGFGLLPADLTGPSRFNFIVDARVAVARIRRERGMS